MAVYAMGQMFMTNVAQDPKYFPHYFDFFWNIL